LFYWDESQHFALLSNSSQDLGSRQTLSRRCRDIIINYHLDNIPSIRLDILKDDVRNAVQAKAENIFLWVNQMFREFRHWYRHAEVRAAVFHFPADLDNKYDRLFAMLVKRLGGSNFHVRCSRGTRKVQVHSLFSLISTVSPLVSYLDVDGGDGGHLISESSDRAWNSR
jgi:nitrate/nitrite-specific signal transduction histidine kinase